MAAATTTTATYILIIVCIEAGTPPLKITTPYFLSSPFPPFNLQTIKIPTPLFRQFSKPGWSKSILLNRRSLILQKWKLFWYNWETFLLLSLQVVQPVNLFFLYGWTWIKCLACSCVDQTSRKLLMNRHIIISHLISFRW